MGEVLQGPWGEQVAQAGGSAQEGAGRRSAPSRPSGPPLPAAVRQRMLDDIEQAAGLDARKRAEARQAELDRVRAEEDEALADEQRLAEEARWTVPGVDADEPAPLPEPTRTSRRAQNVSMAALTRHDASEGEIRAKLVAKGLDEGDVEAELDRLRHAGLIDDAAFAERLIDRLRERKGLGDAAIRSTLRGRLVPQDVVDTVLAEQVEDEDDTAARLLELAQDRVRRLGALPYDVAERRLASFLMRKGYSGSAVRTAVRSALEGAVRR